MQRVSTSLQAKIIALTIKVTLKQVKFFKCFGYSITLL